MTKTLFLTSIGGTVSPLILRMIGDCTEPIFRIVAADAANDVSFLPEVAAFERLPFATDPEYPDALIAALREHHADYVLPLSEEECLVVSKLSEDGRLPCPYLGMAHQLLKTITDKISCSTALETAGLSVVDTRPIDSMDDLEAKLTDMGYPEKRIVFKPRSGRGSRGLRILDAKLDRLAEFGRRDAQIFMDLEQLRATFRDAPEAISQYFLMEFLPGGTLSVDLVAWEGAPLAIFPHRRLGYEWGFVDMAEIVRIPEAETYASDAIQALGLHGLCNIEIGYRQDGTLALVEVNGRCSATAAQNMAVGCNSMSLMMQALNGNPQPFAFDAPARYRVLSEYYEV